MGSICMQVNCQYLTKLAASMHGNKRHYLTGSDMLHIRLGVKFVSKLGVPTPLLSELEKRAMDKTIFPNVEEVEAIRIVSMILKEELSKRPPVKLNPLF